MRAGDGKRGDSVRLAFSIPLTDTLSYQVYRLAMSGICIVIAAGMGTLLAANIGSYYWLRSNCDNETRVCGDVDGDDARTARNFQTVNLLSGVGAIGLFAYSVVE